MWLDNKDDFAFYRCSACHSILTYDDEVTARKTGQICECGTARYSPTNPTEAEWQSPKVKNFCEKWDLHRDPEEVAASGRLEQTNDQL